MWINKDAWLDVKKRLRELESWKELHEMNVVQGSNITVYSATEKAWTSNGFGGQSFQAPLGQRIAVKTVVERILEHLGIELVYVKGTPTTVDMQKKPEAVKP